MPDRKMNRHGVAEEGWRVYGSMPRALSSDLFILMRTTRDSRDKGYTRGGHFEWNEIKSPLNNVIIINFSAYFLPVLAF